MPFRTYASGNAPAFTITTVMTSCDLDIQPKVMKIFLYTHGYSMSHVCKYDVYPMLSFGGVCEVTYRDTETQRDRRAYAINIIDTAKFNVALEKNIIFIMKMKNTNVCKYCKQNQNLQLISF